MVFQAEEKYVKRTRDEQEYGVTLETKRDSGIHCHYGVLEVGGE